MAMYTEARLSRRMSFRCVNYFSRHPKFNQFRFPPKLVNSYDYCFYYYCYYYYGFWQPQTPAKLMHFHYLRAKKSAN